MKRQRQTPFKASGARHTQHNLHKCIRTYTCTEWIDRLSTAYPVEEVEVVPVEVDVSRLRVSLDDDGRRVDESALGALLAHVAEIARPLPVRRLETLARLQTQEYSNKPPPPPPPLQPALPPQNEKSFNLEGGGLIERFAVCTLIPP